MNPSYPKRGFALLITITLMGFLVLLLVSLASLTRVETQVASNSQNLAKARINALFALNIAIGQLQKYAGPDQRVTTTADLVATKDKAGTATPSPVFTTTTQVVVQPGTRFWTAAWGNTEETINYSLRPDQIPPITGNRRGVTPGLLNWLVSGNEATTFTANGTAGGITPGIGITYKPGDTVDLTDLTNPKVKGNPAVVLVGANSVGSGTNAQQDYVVAPLVPIAAPSGAVPGVSGPSTIGRYAWWIGDEGVKARINLQNGYQSLPATAQPAAQISSFITAQRSAVEFMDRDPIGTVPPAQIDTDFNFANSTVPNLLTVGQLPLVNTDAASQTRLAQAAQYRFHDITNRSVGVLSDTYAGGLKKDLTADLADTSGNYSYRPDDDSSVFTPINNSEKNLPTWGHFRNWALTNPNTGGLIDPASARAKSAGIAPTVLFAGVGMNYYLDPATGTAPTITRRFKMAFYPIVVLHNPYTWPIKATDYDVGIRFANYSGNTGGVEPRNTFVLQTKKAADINYSRLAYVDLSSLSIHAIGTATVGLPKTFIRLRLSANDSGGAPRDIQPGERYAYMLTSSAINEYAHANPPVLHRVDKISANTTNYFTLTSQPLTGLEDDADNISLFGNDGSSNNSGTNPRSLRYMETSLVLAKKDGLLNSDWNSNPIGNFHSSIMSVYQLVAQPVSHVSTGSNRFFCKLTADPLHETIGSRVMAFSPKAKTAFRMGQINEGRGNWADVQLVGFNQTLPRLGYIANTNVRAPYNASTALESSNSGGISDTRLAARPYGSTIWGGKDYPVGPLYPGPLLQFNHFGFGFQNPSLSSTLRAILFDVLKSPDRLLSLGQLQHVPWARYSFNTSYPFANSYAPVRIQRSTTYRIDQIRRPEDMMNAGTSAPGTDPLYDLPWLLNRAVWDKYFVSGVPSSLADTNTSLPNSRMVHYRSDNATIPLGDIKYTGGVTNPAYDKAAANLVVAGAFNINSTSEQAWRAVLAGSKGLPTNTDYAEAADQVESAIPYPRFSRNLTAASSITNGPYASRSSTMYLPDIIMPGIISETRIRTMMHNTNRGLYLNNPAIPGNRSSSAVVAELARSIVNEIRTRGPFLSLADFINRPLTSGTEPAGIKGALQAGIDNMDPAVAQVNPDILATTLDGLDSVPAPTDPVVTQYRWDPEHFLGKTATGRSTILNTLWSMSPIHLTQADLLSSLGPMLSPRTDTFTVRTYGETTNPATGKTESRAWCEAVVQRLPDYIGGESAETAPAGLTTADSKAFGRKFKIVSFRWLSPSDI